MTKTEDKDKKYIVWVDYGYDGWCPTGFDSIEGLKAYVVANRDTFLYERVFTKKISVTVKVDVEATIEVE